MALGAAPDIEIPHSPRSDELADPALMKLFSDYVAWQNYAATRFSEAEVTETRAEAALRYAEDIVMMGAVRARSEHGPGLSSDERGRFSRPAAM